MGGKSAKINIRVNRQLLEWINAECCRRLITRTEYLLERAKKEYRPYKEPVFYDCDVEDMPGV
uniref:Uncharacterized protein n=1 Tax=viral metagenome TaxID=1070528 RepID=A0A6M3KX55_9ZZZZ